MLVWFSSPKGVIHIGKYRIYGSHTGREPVDVPWNIFAEYCARARGELGVGLKGILIQAPYTPERLKKLYGKTLDNIIFRYDDLEHMPNKTIMQIAEFFEVKTEDITDISNAKQRHKILNRIKFVIRERSPEC